MGSFSLSGGVEVFGFISPSDTTDTYPVIDPLYGIDGLRNVNTLTDLNNIPTLRRRAGMVVGVSGGTTYYKLNLPPWTNTLSDWSIFNSGGGGVSGDYLPLSGGTVSGGTQFTNGLSANTISATTYLNLPKDVFVTGGTYVGSTITFTNNTGGTFNVTGITSSTTFTGGTISGSTIFTNGLSANTISATTYQNLPKDVFVTGGTYSGSSIIFTNNTGGTFNVSGITSSSSTFTGGTVSGGTIFTNGLTANTISATTYLNLPKDIFVTGGTFTGGSIVFTNNSGGTFNVSGISSFDTFVTGFSYSNNTLTITQNSGSSLNTTINNFSGLTINGNLNVTGSTYSDSISATTYLNLPTDIYVTAYTYNNNTFTLERSSGQPNLSASINDVTGLTSNGTINSTIFSGGTYYGDGSNLTGIVRGSGGGRIFYFNLSNTQTPYYEFSPSATTQTEQSITSSAITSGSSSTIAGFLTPTNVPNITLLVGGIWSFYVHCYKQDSSASFDVYCEVYKRTIGGTETLLFQTDPSSVTTDSPIPSMVVTDGYYSGTTLNSSDRLLVKVVGTNTGVSSKTITFVTEGTQHYSYSTTALYIPIVDTFTTGFTYLNNQLTISRNEGLSNLSVQLNTFTGLTINGNLSVTGTTSSGTISATTYQNLPTDVRVTGGTYNSTSGVATFTNNTGGTFNVSGFFTGSTEVFVTGATYSNNIFTYTNNTGGTFNVLFNSVTGLTVNGNLTITGTTSSGTISATTYQNLPTDIRVTGGTYSNGTATFTNNTGGTFNVTGFFTGGTDVFVTGATYNNNTFTYTNNTGGTFNVLFNTLTGLTVNGNLSVTGTTSSGTISATTYQNLPTDIRVTGATYSNNTFTYTNNTGGTFNVLFNTMTGLTINGNLTTTSNTIVNGTISGSTFISTQSSGDEGGQLDLYKPQTNTSLSGVSVSIDVYQNRFRIFESGSPNRGVYVDLTTAAPSAGTNLLSPTATFDYGKSYAIANSFQLI